ncbi:threonine/serine exporter family protein [Sporolactobacillus sp. CPB3-1]|uniref:Threonine/serine exporter family protein n=1 Tax=Sporolactobacillus mangiferae TaxID=2940498 RepID=A0ABT0MBE7_9BACL|nr:threonine/serine exporter family protein [Sporolactobacillus mangiferae]MCL1631918.1 threonine/serine exporter family protein [Sporolactobacillus mangiferae]
MHLLLVISVQSITSYLATCAFGIIFNIPFKPLLHGGLIGMIAWIIYFFLFQSTGNDFTATFAASFIIAIMSQIFARVCKNPVILYSVAGIIPLVPGGLTYSVMSGAVGNNYEVAIYFAEKVFVLSGSIAMGLIFSEVLFQIYEKIQFFRHKRRSGVILAHKGKFFSK